MGANRFFGPARRREILKLAAHAAGQRREARYGISGERQNVPEGPICPTKGRVSLRRGPGSGRGIGMARATGKRRQFEEKGMRFSGAKQSAFDAEVAPFDVARWVAPDLPARASKILGNVRHYLAVFSCWRTSRAATQAHANTATGPSVASLSRCPRRPSETRLATAQINSGQMVQLRPEGLWGTGCGIWPT